MGWKRDKRRISPDQFQIIDYDKGIGVSVKRIVRGDVLIFKHCNKPDYDYIVVETKHQNNRTIFRAIRIKIMLNQEVSDE